MSHNFQIFGIGKYISGQKAGIDITKIGIQIVRTRFYFIKKQKNKKKSRLPQTKLMRPAQVFLHVFTQCAFISQSTYSYLYVRLLTGQA